MWTSESRDLPFIGRPRNQFAAPWGDMHRILDTTTTQPVIVKSGFDGHHHPLAELARRFGAHDRFLMDFQSDAVAQHRIMSTLNRRSIPLSLCTHFAAALPSAARARSSYGSISSTRASFSITSTVAAYWLRSRLLT